jgi:hypothetical protein
MICSEAKVLGHNININAGALIHPRAKIMATDRSKKVVSTEHARISAPSLLLRITAHRCPTYRIAAHLCASASGRSDSERKESTGDS